MARADTQEKSSREKRPRLSAERVLTGAVALARRDRDRATDHPSPRRRAGGQADDHLSPCAKQGGDHRRDGRSGLRRDRESGSGSRLELGDPSSLFICPSRTRPTSVGPRRSWRARTSPGPATLAHHDAVLGCFRRGGMSLEMTAHAYALVDAYVYGFRPARGDPARNERRRHRRARCRDHRTLFLPTRIRTSFEFTTEHVLKPRLRLHLGVRVRTRPDPERSAALDVIVGAPLTGCDHDEVVLSRLRLGLIAVRSMTGRGWTTPLIEVSTAACSA